MFSCLVGVVTINLLEIEIVYSLQEVFIHNLKLAARFQGFSFPVNTG